MKLSCTYLPLNGNSVDRVAEGIFDEGGKTRGRLAKISEKIDYLKKDE